MLSLLQHIQRPRRAVNSGVLLIYFLLALPTAWGQTQQDIAASLRTMYTRYPAVRTMTSVDAISTVSHEVLGEQKASELLATMHNNASMFLAAREDALASTPVAAKNKTVVVSGLGLAGLTAVAVAAHAGYQVEAFEARSAYTRKLQWAGRQAIANELASIDKKLASDFVDHIAQRLTGFYLHDKDGTYKEREVGAAAVEPGNALDIPQTSEEMFVKTANNITEASIFEEFMFDYISKLPNVKIHRGKDIAVTQRPNGEVGVVGVKGPIETIVLSEGADSRTAKSLGIEYTSTSPKRWQIAGAVKKSQKGRLQKRWRYELGPGGRRRLLQAQAMNGINSDSTWVTADIAEASLAVEGVAPVSTEYAATRQKLIDREFKRIASETMQLAEGEISSLRVDGAVSGKPLAIFQLEQKITRTAVVGTTVILLGDSVGNGHWSTGGGVQIGMITHMEKFKKLLLSFDLKLDRSQSFKEYSEGVVADTLVWHRFGIIDFYPELDREAVVEQFRKAAKGWMETGSKNAFEYFVTMQSNLVLGNCGELGEKYQSSRYPLPTKLSLSLP